MAIVYGDPCHVNGDRPLPAYRPAHPIHLPAQQPGQTFYEGPHIVAPWNVIQTSSSVGKLEARVALRTGSPAGRHADQIHVSPNSLGNPGVVPSIVAKVRAQCAGLGVGWLPRHRVSGLLQRGLLVEKRMADPREPNTLYLAWRGDHDGRALAWWVEQFQQPRLARRLVEGLVIDGA